MIRTPLSRSPLPLEPSATLTRFAEGWMQSPMRPHPAPEVLARWDALLSQWIEEPTISLLIRKYNDNRGHALHHSYGRILVPADNSPAQWVFALALNGYCPSLEQLSLQLTTGELPVAMALGTKEREGAVCCINTRYERIGATAIPIRPMTKASCRPAYLFSRSATFRQSEPCNDGSQLR